jgi:indole-3-glycerol phosphate synthase
MPLRSAGESWDAGGRLASSPRSAVGRKGFAGEGEIVNLADWILRKREQLQRFRPPDVRNLVPTVKDFSQAVRTRREELAVVAEIARATPEDGRLAEVLDIGEMVRRADSASVAAVAIGTDETGFAATPSDLAMAARAASCPVVARDLILVREQLYHARLQGADAVLLMAAAIAPAELRSSIEVLASMHMAAPVEVASESEMSSSLACGARLLVIPAFDSRSLSLALADSLLPLIPRSTTVLVRGPFAKPEDFEALRGRADGIWIAGPLITAKDPEAFLATLVRAAENG